MIQGEYLTEASERQLTRILGDWKQAFPSAGVLALVPEAECGCIESLQAVARSLAVPLMGGVFPALVTGEGFKTSGLVLLRIDPCPGWILVEPMSGDSAAISRLADAVETQLDAVPSAGVPTLFLCFDGLLPNVGTLLYQLYERLGHRVRYAGVNAGSETFQPMPCLFDHERLVESGCIAALVPPDRQFAVAHSYPVSDALFKATSTTGNRIDHIDGKPAMAVYQHLLKSEFGIDVTSGNFYQYAVHYPFGLVTTLDVLVRIPVGLTEDGAIYCVGEVPAGSVLKLLHAPTLDNSQCVEKLMSSLGDANAPLVTFYCAGRRMHFGPDAVAELHALIKASHATQMLGALSLGEIGTDTELGFPTFHNAALVCIR